MVEVRRPAGACQWVRVARVSVSGDWRDAGAVANDTAARLCRTCFVDRHVKFGFADPKKSCIRSFARYVVEVAEMMTEVEIAMAQREARAWITTH